MSNTYKKKLFLICLLVLSFVITSFFSTIILVENNTPKFKQSFLIFVNTSVESLLTRIRYAFNPTLVLREKRLKELKKQAKPIGKGVYSSQIETSSYTRYDLDKVEWITQELIFQDGTRKTIQVPKTEMDEIR